MLVRISGADLLSDAHVLDHIAFFDHLCQLSVTTRMHRLRSPATKRVNQPKLPPSSTCDLGEIDDSKDRLVLPIAYTDPAVGHHVYERVADAERYRQLSRNNDWRKTLMPFRTCTFTAYGYRWTSLTHAAYGLHTLIDSAFGKIEDFAIDGVYGKLLPVKIIATSQSPGVYGDPKKHAPDSCGPFSKWSIFHDAIYADLAYCLAQQDHHFREILLLTGDAEFVAFGYGCISHCARYARYLTTVRQRLRDDQRVNELQKADHEQQRIAHERKLRRAALMQMVVNDQSDAAVVNTQTPPSVDDVEAANLLADSSDDDLSADDYMPDDTLVRDLRAIRERLQGLAATSSEESWRQYLAFLTSKK